jgi:GT2 family glycosyltransferase
MINKNSDYKVAVVIVTFNRKEFLLELLDALGKQTYKVSVIYIVDNSLDFETASFLKKRRVLNKIPHGELKENWVYEEIESILGVKLIYMKTYKNIGGAGGFNLGLREAYKRGFELFWLMDDDIEPLSEALEYQIGFVDFSKCITPSKRALDGELLHWWGWLDLRILREKPIPKVNYHGDYAEVNISCFEGLLIHRDIVSQIGFPNPKFFIYGDDVIYGYKASLHTKCIYLIKPTFVKKLKKKNFHKRFGKYYPFASKNLSYYLMRNYLLKAKEIKSVSPKKINMGFVYIYHIYYFFKQLAKALFVEWDLKKLSFLIRGFFDSFKVKQFMEQGINDNK